MAEPRGLTDYVVLGRSGLRVSPLCLGTMTFGEEWGWGSNKEISRKVFDTYAERGGNFIDAANLYTGGTSERFVGEFLQDRRDRFVLATKYSFSMNPGDPNAGGNQRKNLVHSLDASLKRLKTDYIDLYWVHAWDARTSIEETMRALDDAVRAGKVLHVGASNMPAWKVSQANTIANFRGWSPLVALQIEYSLIERTPEREVIPMARELGLAVTPWSPLGGGVLTGKYNPSGSAPNESKSRHEYGGEVADAMLRERNLRIAEEVGRVAKEIGRSPAQVALNWLARRPGVTSIILGARKLEQLNDNLASLGFDLPPEHADRLDAASRIDLGYPGEFLQRDNVRGLLTSGTNLI